MVNLSQLPKVTIKFAQTLDGKIATIKNESRWISGKKSLVFAHKLRSQNQAILVGIGTIRKDDPHLTIRMVKGENPQKIILDSKLSIGLNFKVLKKYPQKTIIATTNQAPLKKIKKLEKLGAKVLVVKRAKRGVDLYDLLKKLKKQKINSILVEGGAEVITSFLKKMLFNRIIIVIAPKVFGKGKNNIDQREIKRAFKPFLFSSRRIYKLENDVIFDGILDKSKKTNC